jgi:hypothetical protein
VLCSRIVRNHPLPDGNNQGRRRSARACRWGLAAPAAAARRVIVTACGRGSGSWGGGWSSWPSWSCSLR